MIKQTADVVFAQLRHHAVAFGIEEFIAIVFPQTLVDTMPGPLSWKSGLGMKVTVKPFWMATFLAIYLYIIDLVRLPQQGVKAHAEFSGRR